MANQAPAGHEKIETSNFLMIVLMLLTVAVGGSSRSCRCSSSAHHAAGRGPQALHRAAAGRARRLHPRGLLQLPLADDPPVPRRDAALRRLLSKAGEFVYDHPFQWGSKRTGPDLHRVGGKYSDEWHRIHLNNPRDLVPESNMPAYPWLEQDGGRPGRHGAEDEGAAHRGRALHRRRDRQGAESRQGQDRTGRRDRLPAGARHRGQVRPSERVDHGHQ
jgi:cytochrome c oxidase cbb3-type subunit 2